MEDFVTLRPKKMVPFFSEKVLIFFKIVLYNSGVQRFTDLPVRE